ncbi:PaaX family transcriptional regulator [Amycolatopsis benzoatilytica]|uniref:PaaX family transcriptional regulator n=1 Tax=Amycolatopsis benzoatilytica TaxID=346045 RepID=UPI00037FFD8C|nr:PaaX family transcriptional regulator C-terminal domain-containing protein [Amycolatopsis benzoatilytica]
MTAVPETTDVDGGRAAQPRHLIVSVYGVHHQAGGKWLSVAALIDLLAVVGIDEPAVRSSISRLKRRGVLEAVRLDGAAGYELSGTALDLLHEGDDRIFRRDRAKLADGWLLAVFSVPEAERHKRHVLRTQLSRLGFGTASSGVWIAPAHLYEATVDTLDRLELSEYADLFRAEHLAFGDPAEKVREWWDLDQLDELYTAFREEHEPTLRRWQRRRTTPADEAFADYLRVLTDWRRMPYLDPCLPAELLPDGWSGIRAAEVFFALHDRLEDAARKHLRAVISG